MGRVVAAYAEIYLARRMETMMDYLDFHELVILFGAIIVFCLWQYWSASRALARARTQPAAKKAADHDSKTTAS